MIVLHIEHPVPDYEAWKQAFDADPSGREKSGVRRYRILRAMDDPNYVMIDLEFDTTDGAEALLSSLRRDLGSGPGHAHVGSTDTDSGVGGNDGVLTPVVRVPHPPGRIRRPGPSSAGR